MIRLPDRIKPNGYEHAEFKTFDIYIRISLLLRALLTASVSFKSSTGVLPIHLLLLALLVFYERMTTT